MTNPHENKSQKTNDESMTHLPFFGGFPGPASLGNWRWDMFFFATSPPRTSPMIHGRRADFHM